MDKLKVCVATCAATALVLLASVQAPPAPVAAQDTSLVKNPELYLPAGRDNDNVMAAIRRARAEELNAMRLQREGKKEESLDAWREALNRYEDLRKEFLPPDLDPAKEILVRSDWVDADVDTSRLIFAESWVPLSDYMNDRMRSMAWPRPLRDQVSLRQNAKGSELLQKGLAEGDMSLLRRCARYYQFSDSGRVALRILAEHALENGDSLLAVRWLGELKASFPDHWSRDPMLTVQYVRACRDAGMAYELGMTLRHVERGGLAGDVDVGGKQIKAVEYLKQLLAEPAPQSRPELLHPGWRTLQGADSRNGIAPPIAGIGAMMDLDPTEAVGGAKLAARIAALEPQQDEYGYGSSVDQQPVPMVFPVAHESGVFVHKVPSSDDAAGVEQLVWLRHGRETSPILLEVPKALRYSTKQSNSRRWYGGQTQDARLRYRVKGHTIARLRWQLDNREADVLFAVLGQGSPSKEKGTEPSGNQIQAFTLAPDPAAFVTLPNRKVESSESYDFLKHVVFLGTPLVKENRLYIAGVTAEKDTSEVWMFCFDVTPKGDASAGEGKLLWRTMLCARKLVGDMWGYGNQPVQVPEVSSVAEHGGLLFVSTHAGCTACVDRTSGELCWLSRYARENNITRGWFANAPLAAGGMVVTAPYDCSLSLVLNAITGQEWMQYPMEGAGPKTEYEYTLGVIDNRMIVQGRSRLYSVGLTSFKGGAFMTDWARLEYETELFGEVPTGRGLIAGDNVLVPLAQHIAIYDARTGKLKSKVKLEGVSMTDAPVTLSVYCRGERYKDAEGIERFKPVTVTDPDTGSVFSAEHLANGATFKFASGKTATVVKETFLVIASAKWVHVFQADDGGK